MSTMIQCHKCGKPDPGVAFHEGGITSRKSRKCYMHQLASTEGEHLHYTCLACAYDWTSPCKDASPQEHMKAAAERAGVVLDE